jgi:spore coat protein CotF
MLVVALTYLHNLNQNGKKYANSGINYKKHFIILASSVNVIKRFCRNFVTVSTTSVDIIGNMLVVALTYLHNLNQNCKKYANSGINYKKVITLLSSVIVIKLF